MQASTLTPNPLRTGTRFGLAVLRALLRGGFLYRGGHLPPAGHRVPDDFTGVGVAAATDPAHDDLQLEHLARLGVRRVRIDLTYGDADGPAGRLFPKLAAAGYRITLHLLQPFDEARRMPDAGVEERWRSFVADTLDRFGALADLIEVTSTVNRRRWAGYSLDGLLAAWGVAHDEVRRRGLVLAGPSITDFEPVYNVGLLSLLRDRGQLPDIHTDNLFAERAIRPERWDHKILGHRLAPLIRFNLVKKARLLARIGAQAGVPRLASPAAFWTLPRIERRLPDSEQKQADYLTRYFVLCAASGALEHAGWGPLACHREGLVDDGRQPYPRLERITHYAAVTGPAYRPRPAFHALAAFNRLIPGSVYRGRLNRGQDLEVHAFDNATRSIHVVWTTNARAAALPDLYDAAALAAVRIFDRDGAELSGTAALETRLVTLAVTEKPLYLAWPAGQAPAVSPAAAPLPGLTVHAHGSGLHYYCRNADWHGMVRAADGPEADALIRALHPEHVGGPRQADTLRRARNAIWTVSDPRNPVARLAVKQPVKHHLHKKLLDRLKPSKARRSWNGASELLRRGLGSAAPVAWFEQRSGRDLTLNWYTCEYVPGDTSIGKLFSAYTRGEEPAGFPAQTVYARLADFLLRMHGRGIFFRDLSGGNILVSAAAPGEPDFALIDTARIRLYPQGVPLRQRLSDLARACHKLHPEGREAFMALYLQGLGRRFTPLQRASFALYDLKAALKRRLRKTALYRKLKR
ncbi:BUD32 family EKC/KEOPS complex subunit [Pseudothauera rhizosphaerae]|uniref:Lipopolysaccharide kinase (Kdo/WaaP) family protein n=1 Tax=Pseudothauera rhizosphaerae TaxID=2565932 RepID=A0A4S4AFX7_9RHOO|nr:hypothetical protein [Pseudothauera rhizosphaerae]THF57657.1 hypothetical protein E6O51_17670 [Pseudothauera rhizosphaerae]